jgi:hypothetical protein
MARTSSRRRAVRACLEILADAALYVVIVLIGIVLLSQAIELAL